MIETKDSNNKLFSKLKCEILGKKSPVFCFPTRGENFTKGRRKGERVRGNTMLAETRREVSVGQSSFACFGLGFRSDGRATEMKDRRFSG